MFIRWVLIQTLTDMGREVLGGGREGGGGWGVIGVTVIYLGDLFFFFLCGWYKMLGVVSGVVLLEGIGS